MIDLIRGCLIGALLCWALLTGIAARADIIPVFDVVTPGVGVNDFNYNVVVSNGSRVNTGDYFTIYDFDFYIAGSAWAPADWAISVQNIGVTPAGQIIGDDPSIVNITFTYTGLSSITGPVDPLGGTDAFGASAARNADHVRLRPYGFQTHKSNPGKPDDNTFQSGQGMVGTPDIPEASSLMLLLPGLLPLSLLLRRQTARK